MNTYKKRLATPEKKWCRHYEYLPYIEADLLEECKYCKENRKQEAKARLEYLRIELRAERISYGELAELASLKEYIEEGDVELLEPAGVPEGKCPHMGAEGCNWKRGLPCNK